MILSVTHPGFPAVVVVEDMHRTGPDLCSPVDASDLTACQPACSSYRYRLSGSQHRRAFLPAPGSPARRGPAGPRSETL